jgi:hypothetical protein
VPAQRTSAACKWVLPGPRPGVPCANLRTDRAESCLGVADWPRRLAEPRSRRAAGRTLLLPGLRSTQVSRAGRRETCSSPRARLSGACSVANSVARESSACQRSRSSASRRDLARRRLRELRLMTVGRLAGIPGIAEAPVVVAVELDGGPAHPDAGAKIVVRSTTSTATCGRRARSRASQRCSAS